MSISILIEGLLSFMSIIVHYMPFYVPFDGVHVKVQGKVVLMIDLSFSSLQSVQSFPLSTRHL
jgi:hypothetical protein